MFVDDGFSTFFQNFQLSNIHNNPTSKTNPLSNFNLIQLQTWSVKTAQQPVNEAICRYDWSYQFHIWLNRWSEVELDTLNYASTL